MKSPVAVIIAIATGLIILAGYFIPHPALVTIRNPMMNWAIVLSGVAGLVAIIHLIFGIHWARARSEGLKQWQSIVIIVTFLLTLIAGLFLGPASSSFQRVATSIVMPIESSLMALLAVTLTLTSLKLLQRQRNWMGIVFFFTTILFLILNSGMLSFTDNIPILRNLLSGLQLIPSAGARGILLGIALGSLATGIRILIASDRPYEN